MPRARILPALIGALFTLGLASTGIGAQFSKDGAKRVVVFDENVSYLKVMEALKLQAFDNGWRVMDVQEIDMQIADEADTRALRFNKVVKISNNRELADIVGVKPQSTLVIPTSVAIYRSPQVYTSGGDYTDVPGRMMIVYIDPLAKANMLGIDPNQSIRTASRQLEDIVQATADFLEKEYGS